MDERERFGALLREAYQVPSDYVLPAEALDRIRTENTNVTPYVILFTARSGSTFLTHELKRTGVLSLPQEWFNWSHVTSQTEANARSPEAYISNVVRENLSKNNIFGLEMNWLQYCALSAICPPQRLFPKRIRWFMLRRRNLVAQAVSIYMADMTKLYHSYEIDDDKASAFASVPYDAEALKRAVNEFVRQELRMNQMMRNNHVSPINLYYEDLTADPVGTAMLVANVMGIWLPEDYLKAGSENPIKKVATARNQEFEETFRKEEQAFLADALDRRPDVLAAAQTI